MKTRGKILWVDDEIEHLKPHILFLEEKGFEIETASNGVDGLNLVKNRDIQLALIDQYMPGMDGIDTLRELKLIDLALPVIMVTKSEEESLMNEAISEKVTQFLIKPVNPSQVFMAIKQVLESGQIQEEKITRDFLKEYQKISRKTNLLWKNGGIYINSWFIGNWNWTTIMSRDFNPLSMRRFRLVIASFPGSLKRFTQGGSNQITVLQCR